MQVGNLSGTGTYTRKIVEYMMTVGSSTEFVLVWPKEAAGPHLMSPGRMNILYAPTGPAVVRAVQEQRLIRRAARHVDPDIIHYPASIGPWIPGMPAGSMLKRCIVTVHDLAYLKFPERFSVARRLYYRMSMVRGARRAAHVIADSESTRQDLVELGGIPAERITVVHLGVEDKFAPVDDDAALARVREKYSLPPRFFLFVGTIEPRKNVACIVEAYAQLADGLADIDLVIAGRRGWKFGPLYAQIERADLADRILMPGRIDDEDLPAVYSCAEAFVWPTIYEGFGLPLLEAMACGTPVISSDIGVVREVVGDAALLIDPRSPQQLADAMQRVISGEDFRDDLVQRGIARARQFRWEQTATRTLEVYRRVANER
jgi:glycosyltransferase involved in cell wall biosynthesis